MGEGVSIDEAVCSDMLFRRRWHAVVYEYEMERGCLGGQVVISSGGGGKY